MPDSKSSIYSSSEMSFEDDIELQNLDSVIHIHDSYLAQKHSEVIPYGNQRDSGEEWDNHDEGRRGLLGVQEGTNDYPPLLVHRSFVRLLWRKVHSIAIESTLTLFLTTIGLVFTGEILDHVSHWQAIQQLKELIIIIPVILNLKGNLEMNLSARLGTAANVGELDKPETRRSIIMGNLALLQVQATVVSFVTACASSLLGLVLPHETISPDIPSDIAAIPSTQNATSLVFHRTTSWSQVSSFDYPRSGLVEFVMVSSSTMTAACLSSLLLGSLMSGLVILCRRVGSDPDNIAPPIAACLGDLVTLCIFALISATLIDVINTPIPSILIIFIIVSSLLCLLFTHRNPWTKDLLKQGWSPLFGAMVISGGAGIVLDLFVTRYENFALLSILISGLPGIIGSIFVSRLSTALHSATLAHLPYLSPDRHPPDNSSEKPSARLVMIVLFLVTLPIELISLSILHAIGWLSLPLVFVLFSSLFFCGAVAASLYLARFLTEFLWSKNLDPDIYALPIHSALVDLIGQLLLVLCFELVSLLGVHVENMKPEV